MNRYIICSSAVLCSFLASGCSTHTVQQTEKVTTTAEAYTRFMIELLDKTKTRVIAMDSEQLADSRSSTDRDVNETMLSQKNLELDKWVTAANALQTQNTLLQKYFRALQILIEAPAGSEMSEPISNISDSISKINQADADRRGKPYRDRTLTRDQKSNVGGISATLISSHYANKVKTVLIRDRNIIDQQIALHTKQLDMLESMYKRRIRLAKANDYANNIQGPYVSVSANNHYDRGLWAANRNQWFERRDELSEFADAKAAGKAFRQAWLDILQGKKDIGAARAILGDVSGLVEHTYQLHDSYHNPPRNTLHAVPPLPQ